MSFLKAKSEINILGAESLIEETFYASSVHCSYYATFQKLKHLYIRLVDIDYEELSNNIRADQFRNTHKYIIEEFCKEFYPAPHQRYIRRNLKQKINDLKTFREDSDYENMQINHDISSRALNKSKEILREINK